MTAITGTRLNGARAVVTGAAQGIGLAICRAFAAEGARVFGVDQNLEGLRTAFAELAEQFPGALAHAEMDVADEASVRAGIAAAAAELGGLTTLVCNAATLTPLAPVEDLASADWRRALDVNLTGAFLTAKYGIPHLRAAGGGSVILTASQMGRVGSPGQAAYCATKGALIQLAKVMALDYAREHIRVNTLSPGGTATERLFRRFGGAEGAEREWGPTHPVGRLGRVEEIAAGAVFLASSESEFMTGADLLMDGGYAAR